jgi:hypothetical protein
MAFSIASILGDGLLGQVKGIINSFKLDPEVKAKLDAAVNEREDAIRLQELELQQKIQDAANAEVLAQIAVNEADAKGSLYQASWRPTIGYICGAGLLYQFLGQPLLAWISTMFKFVPPPVIDTGSLLTLLFGMLGLGALRTIDKKNAS